MPRNLLKAISINFKDYKIDTFSREIAVWLLIGNTGGFAHLFSINYQLKHNLKREKKENKKKNHRSVMLTVTCCSVLRTWECFSLPINFSQCFFFFHYVQVWTDRSQLALLCLSSCCLAAKNNLHFFPLLGMERVVGENTRNGKLLSVLRSFRNNILFLF